MYTTCICNERLNFQCISETFRWISLVVHGVPRFFLIPSEKTSRYVTKWVGGSHGRITAAIQKQMKNTH